LGSLTAHLLEDGDHGRLGFHPSCPVCRQERLFGSLSSEPVLSRRVQAALASGVLAFSAAAPAAAIAAEPDRQQEGVTAPEQPTGGVPQQPGSGEADAPDFDPGDETPLPVEVAPAPTSPLTGGGSDDTGDGPPVDSEPVDDREGRLLATEPETETPAAPESDAPVPTGEEAPTLPAPPPSDTAPIEVPPAEPTTPAAPGAPGAPGAALQSEVDPNQSESEQIRVLTGTSESDQMRPTSSGSAPSAAPSQPPAVTIPAQGPPAPSPLPAPPSTEPADVVQAAAPAQTAPEPVAKNAPFHVVQPGESLWSIARKLLGADASPAQIAREVNRLWELNKDRIGTGDPDLLKVGTRLTLR
jgi:LysM repeat protein